MDYTNIYCTKDNIDGFPCRFLLGKLGKKPLIVIGLNPSIADETNPDATMRKILGFLTRWNEEGTFTHDCFIMLNLYPLIETYSGELKDHNFNNSLYTRNIETISSIMMKNPTADVLLCYGDTIEDVPKLKDYRDSILKMLTEYTHLALYRLGNLTDRQNPRHPSRLAYSTSVERFVNPFLKE